MIQVNSLNFIIFLLSVAIVTGLTPLKYRIIPLLIFSTLFYILNSGVNFIFIGGLIIINFIVAKYIRKKSLFYFLIILNALIILSFKLIPLHSFLSFRWTANNNFPLGLSYISLTLITYSIEVYRQNIKSENNFAQFFTYTMLFTKVSQGPIEKPKPLIQNLKSLSFVNYELFNEGLKYIIWGFFKKLVIADRLAIYVNHVFGGFENQSGSTLLLATVFYTFQIYADFSGYTDIAIGSSKLLGINLTNNFSRPYLSKSLKEFWTRWHITLSIFLRDYIFLPLSYKFTKIFKLKHNQLVYVIATFITFVICGVWHGIGLNYLTWGILWALLLSLSLLLKKIRVRAKKIFKINTKNTFLTALNIFFIFIIINITWLFFRFNPNEAFLIIAKILTNQGALFVGDLRYLFYGIFGIIILVLIEIRQEKRNITGLPFILKNHFLEKAIYSFITILIISFGVFDGSQFIYFNF